MSAKTETTVRSNLVKNKIGKVRKMTVRSKSSPALIDTVIKPTVKASIPHCQYIIDLSQVFYLNFIYTII